MMSRPGLCACLCACVFAIVQPAAAQQTLNVTLGAFTLRGEGSRGSDDLLGNNLKVMSFDIGSLGGLRVGGEWLVAVGEHLEVGTGIGYTRQSTPSTYRHFVDPTGNDISQELALRVIPVTFTARVLLRSVNARTQPYVGGGVNVYSWRYEQTGDFVDLPSQSIYHEQVAADGITAGPTLLGGVRFASGAFSVGGEVRYQRGEAQLDQRFAAPKLDVGGLLYQATAGLRFGF